MKSNNDYEHMTNILKKKFNENNSIVIRHLIDDHDLSPYSYDKIRALLKYLLKTGKLNIKKKALKFENSEVFWSPNIKLELPKTKINEFKEVRLCMTLPPFNIFGLTDFLKKEQVEINLLVEEFDTLFNSAKNSIKICSPFIEWNGFKYFQDTLLSKAKNNVKLQILSREIDKKENISRYNNIKKIYNFFKLNYLEDQLKDIVGKNLAPFLQGHHI